MLSQRFTTATNPSHRFAQWRSFARVGPAEAGGSFSGVLEMGAQKKPRDALRRGAASKGRLSVVKMVNSNGEFMVFMVNSWA